MNLVHVKGLTFSTGNSFVIAPDPMSVVIAHDQVKNAIDQVAVDNSIALDNKTTAVETLLKGQHFSFPELVEIAS